MTLPRRAKSQPPVDLILAAYLENHPDTPDPTRLRQAVAQTLADLDPGSKVLAEGLAQAAHGLRGTAPAIVGRRNSEAATPPGDMTDAQGVEEIEPGETDEHPRLKRRVRRTIGPQDHALGQSELAFEFHPEEQPETASDQPTSPIPAADEFSVEAEDRSDAVASVAPEPRAEPEAGATESAPRKRKRPSRPASQRRKASLDATGAEESDLDRTTAPGGDSDQPASRAEPDSDTETEPVRHTAESVFQSFPQSEKSQARPLDRPGGSAHGSETSKFQDAGGPATGVAANAFTPLSERRLPRRADVAGPTA